MREGTVTGKLNNPLAHTGDDVFCISCFYAENEESPEKLQAISNYLLP